MTQNKTTVPRAEQSGERGPGRATLAPSLGLAQAQVERLKAMGLETGVHWQVLLGAALLEFLSLSRSFRLRILTDFLLLLGGDDSDDGEQQRSGGDVHRDRGEARRVAVY